MAVTVCTTWFSSAPVIDGKEDDEVWRDAPAAGDFLEFQPTEGKAPRYRTTFKAAYDDRNLYIFLRAYDPRWSHDEAYFLSDETIWKLPKSPEH